MKIRNGFVSNSSSTSFIISGKDFKSTLDITKYFIEQINNKCDGVEYKNITNKMKRNPKYDKPIYIDNLGGQSYYVAKNKDGDFMLDICRQYDYDFDHIKQYAEGYFDAVFDKIKKWYIPEYNLVGKENLNHSYYRCKKCHKITYLINDLIQCPICRIGENGERDKVYIAQQRKHKIKRILKNGKNKTR